jgi:3-oxoacyl-[acyl-carrier-protein] synthase-3
LEGIMRNVQILSTGGYVPERVVTNAEVDALMGESTNEWLLANVGIRERRWMAPDQVTSDLIVEASKKALERAGVSASDLDPITSPQALPWSSRPNSAQTRQAVTTSTPPARGGSLRSTRAPAT